ncbi:MAG TPA: hypothetical protein VJ912_02895 [Candidatus Nanoarchaeia archaeon]|nr:hypothetical protein [Candidatus Nanoarchaeia archaeon]
MNFIKKIFDDKVDESVHLQFQKFSKGEFRDKAMFHFKNQSGKYSISTSPEYANEMVKTLASKLGDEKVPVTGAIVSTLDLKDYVEYKDIKQFQGVKRYIIDKEMSGNEILELIDKLPKNFFALSFSTPDKKYELKIKPKAPKSGKPGKKTAEKPKPDFCKLKTTDKNFASEFLFEVDDIDNIKQANVEHTYYIDKLEIPEEAKKSGDFKKMREEAKRVGKIVRGAVIDGKEKKTEKEVKI